MASPIRIIGTAVRWLAPVLVVVAGAAVARTLILGRAAPPKSERPPRVLPVDVVTVRVDDHESTIRAYGTVRPRRTLALRPTVGGPIGSMHPALIQGGRIDAGEIVASIDERDYVLAVKTADAALVAAKTDLDIELGNAYVAQREWELLDADLEVTEEGRRLALREPYVERRRADLDSARANLERAKLDLERTKLVAPFDALVLSEDVEIGTQVGAGTQIAQLVDRTEFLVEVAVPSKRLSMLEFDGATAQLVRDGHVREGRVERLLGEVDAAGRMARIQVAIPDPLRRERGIEPVLLGSYVSVDLPCRTIENAISIPREALREGDVVWVVDVENTLEIREVDVLMRRPADVLVASDLGDGTRVIVSPISVPLPGLRVSPTAVDDDESATDLDRAAAAFGVAPVAEGEGQ